jgi:arylsulfatase A-like enzyme
VDVEYRAEQVRIGLADPRIVTPVSRPRRRSDREHPSIVVVQVETLRADVLGLYGGGRADLTPNLDALAAEAVVWERAMAPSSWTLPSTATLFTGLFPSAHGVVKPERAVMPAAVPTLAEIAREQGIVTGALLANDLLRSEAGFLRGFSVAASLPATDARGVGSLARAFLENHAGQQFFLMLHHWDPHYPYDAPAALRERFAEVDLAQHDADHAMERILSGLRMGRPVEADDPDVRVSRARYLAAIAFWDEGLGELIATIESLGLAESTIVIVTSDHGEEFGEHGWIGHGSWLHDETVHVPLLAWAPGGQLGEPRRIEGIVSTAGLFGWILDLLDVPYDRSDAVPPLSLHRSGRYAFSETNQGVVADGRGDALRRLVTSVRGPDDLLIWRHPLPEEDDQAVLVEEYFDLSSDPGARTPLPLEGSGYEALSSAMRDALRWSAERRAATPLPGVDAEWLDALQRIGYVDGPQEN